MRDIANMWRNVREIDLRPIRESALQPVKLALVGATGAGRLTPRASLLRDEWSDLRAARHPVAGWRSG